MISWVVSASHDLHADRLAADLEIVDRSVNAVAMTCGKSLDVDRPRVYRSDQGRNAKASQMKTAKHAVIPG